MEMATQMAKERLHVLIKKPKKRFNYWKLVSTNTLFRKQCCQIRCYTIFRFYSVQMVYLFAATMRIHHETGILQNLSTYMLYGKLRQWRRTEENLQRYIIVDELFFDIASGCAHIFECYWKGISVVGFMEICICIGDVNGYVCYSGFK